MTQPPNPMHHRLDPQKVTTVLGEDATVLTAEEARVYTTSKDRYLAETKFTENTDLVDLDRLLTFELFINRWQQWLFAGVDYEGDILSDEKELIANIKYFSDQINKIKDSMGLNKKTRDQAAAEGNFAAWLSDLKARAKLFGVHRQDQLQRALVLVQELTSLIGAFDRSDEEERRKIGLESEKDIVEWVRTVMLPEFHAIDAYFREHSQRYWVRDM